MTSPTSSPARADGPQLHLNEPPLTLEPARTVIPLSHYSVEGVGSGNLEHLKFRPFADFHPVARVELTQGACAVWYAKPLKPLSERQAVTMEEARLLVSQVINARRRLVAGQALYLYPGAEAFGVDPVSQRLRIRVINARPRGRLQDLSHAQLSIESFCDLLARRCPEGWARVRPRREGLTSLEALEQLLSPPSPWRALAAALRVAAWALLAAALLSAPAALWGPEPLRGALRARLLPPAQRAAEGVSAWLEGLASSTEEGAGAGAEEGAGAGAGSGAEAGAGAGAEAGAEAGAGTAAPSGSGVISPSPR